MRAAKAVDRIAAIVKAVNFVIATIFRKRFAAPQSLPNAQHQR
jgi:hypothetical protein